MNIDPLLFCEDRVEELVDNHHESLGGVLYTALRMAVDDGAIDLDNLRAIYEKATAEGKIAMDSAVYEVIGFSCKEILEADRRFGEAAGAGSLT